MQRGSELEYLGNDNLCKLYVLLSLHKIKQQMICFQVYLINKLDEMQKRSLWISGAFSIVLCNLPGRFVYMWVRVAISVFKIVVEKLVFFLLSFRDIYSVLVVDYVNLFTVIFSKLLGMLQVFRGSMGLL